MYQYVKIVLFVLIVGEDDYETDDDSQLHIAETCTAVAAIQPDTSIPHHQVTNSPIALF